MPALLALPSPDPGFELLVSSQGMSHGALQTDGVQVMPRAFLRFGDVQIGGQWRNVSSPLANGVAGLFLKFSHKFRRGQLDAGALYRIRTGANDFTDSRAWEFSGSGRQSFGRLGLRINADFSPKDFERGKSLFVQFGPSFDINPATMISAGFGRRERKGGPDYTAFNAGISRTVDRRLTIDVRYFDTNRSELGEPFQKHIVVSARATL